MRQTCCKKLGFNPDRCQRRRTKPHLEGIKHGVGDRCRNGDDRGLTDAQETEFRPVKQDDVHLGDILEAKRFVAGPRLTPSGLSIAVTTVPAGRQPNAKALAMRMGSLARETAVFSSTPSKPHSIT